MPQDNDELRSSGVTPPPGKVGAKADPGRAPPPRGYWLVKGIADRVARFFALSDYRAEVSDRVVPVVMVGDLTKLQEDDETKTGADYRIFSVDLAVARAARVVIPGTQDLGVSNVTLVSLTAGATFLLSIGEREGIPFGGDGMSVGTTFELNPTELRGLLVANAAQPAAVALFMVSPGIRVSRKE